MGWFARGLINNPILFGGLFVALLTLGALVFLVTCGQRTFDAIVDFLRVLVWPPHFVDALREARRAVPGCTLEVDRGTRELRIKDRYGYLVAVVPWEEPDVPQAEHDCRDGRGR